MAKMNRREALVGMAAVPMVGDVVRPCVLGALDRNGSCVQRSVDRDEVTGIVSLYARMRVTGRQLHRVRDDSALRRLIDEEAKRMADEFYNYCKKVALDGVGAVVELDDRFLPQMVREGDRFVYVKQ